MGGDVLVLVSTRSFFTSVKDFLVYCALARKLGGRNSVLLLGIQTSQSSSAVRTTMKTKPLRTAIGLGWLFFFAGMLFAYFFDGLAVAGGPAFVAV